MDYSGMLPELLAIIAQKHIVFYEDYYSFAGVCKSWHLAAIQAAKIYRFPNGPPSRFPSLILAQRSKDKEFRELLLLSNKSIRKKSIRKIRLPQIYDKVFVTSCGWLVTVGEDFSSQLINPLSCETINLPKVNTFDIENVLEHSKWHKGIWKLILVPNNNQSSLVLPLVVVVWGRQQMLGFCQPEDSKWTRVPSASGPGGVLDFTYYNGTVYCLGGGVDEHHIYAWDVHGKDQTVVVKISAIPKDLYDEEEGFPVAYLLGVDDGEKKRLLVVIRKGKIENTYKTKRFHVFGYDLEKREWSKVKDLGTKALFVGNVSSFSIDQDTAGVIKGNSIYFTDDALFIHGLYGNGKTKDMGIYHLSDGTIEPYYNGVSLSQITPPVWLQSM